MDDNNNYDKLPPDVIDIRFDDELPKTALKPGDPKDLVQRQFRDSVWRTLCNVCHQPIPVPYEDWWDPSGGDDFKDDNNHPVCYEVVPCYVEIQQIPPCFVGGGFGVGENWHKQKSKTFAVCSACWNKLGVAITQLPVTPKRPDSEVREGDIRPDSIVPLPECSTVSMEDLEPLD